MEILDGRSEIDFAGRTVITLGKFDGLHLGHKELIGKTAVHPDNQKSVVFTFSYDSKFIYREPQLLSNDVRRKMIESMNVDYLVEFPLMDKEAEMSPEDFVSQILVGRFHVAKIIAGKDVSFGYMGRGDEKLLRQLGEKYDYEVMIIKKIEYDGSEISSSRIRAALAEGKKEAAYAMLGHDL